jgi:hypothetical protein
MLPVQSQLYVTRSVKFHTYSTMPTGTISLHANYSVEQHNNIMLLMTLPCYHGQITLAEFNTICILTTITRMRVRATQTAIRTINFILPSTTLAKSSS